HFSTEQWADLANGQVAGERRQAMQRHLSTGCKDCAALLSLWTHVGEAAKRESSYQPPDSAVRHVRGAFALLAEPRRSKTLLEIPRLVFDSLWQPAMAGVRSATSSPRQVLYRAGEFSVEMRLEPQPGSDRIYIAGQLSGRRTQSEGIPKVAVVISG